MTTPPDKLFRDGLEHHRKAAPNSAWERIESGLDRKQNRSQWMKIAASLLLLLVAFVLFWHQNHSLTEVATVLNDSSAKNTIDNQLSTDKSYPSSKLNSIVERSRNNHPEVVLEDSPVVERSRNEQGSGIRNNHPDVVLEDSTVVERSRNEQGNGIRNNHPDVVLEDSPVVEHSRNEQGNGTDTGSESKGTSITYTAKEVNEKFLKKELTLEATPEKKNTSGLQKVIDLALDFKNEGTVLGDLREKKNELLSFNMSSNKRETNK